MRIFLSILLGSMVYCASAQLPELKINDGTGAFLITDIDYSHDGLYYAIGGRNQTIRIYDSSTDRKISDIHNIGDTETIRFSPDGSLIATSSGRSKVSVYNIESGFLFREFVLSGAISEIQKIVFNDQGEQLIILNKHQVYVFDLFAGRLKKTIRLPGAGAASLIVTASNSGQIIAVGNPRRTVKIYDFSIEEWRELKGHTSMLSNLEFNNNGSLLSSGSIDGVNVVWDVASGSKLLDLKIHTSPITVSKFCPNNDCLLTASKEGGLVKINLESGEILKDHTNDHGVGDIAFTQDGEWYMISLKEWLEKRNVASGERMKTDILPISQISAISENRSGLIAIARGKDIYLKDHITNTEDFFGSTSHEINSLDISNDGKYLVTGGGKWKHGEIGLWDLEGDSLIKFLEQPEEIENVVFNEISTGFIANHSSSIVWDIGSLEITSVFQEERVRSVSKDGKQVLLKDDYGYKLRNSETGQVDAIINVTEPNWRGKHGRADFFPDLKRMVAGVSDHLSVFDVSNGQKIFDLNHSNDVTDFSISRDGQHVVSADAQGIKLWDANRGEEIYSINNTAIKFLRFLEEGEFFVSGNQDGAIVLWETRTGALVVSTYHLMDNNDWVSITPYGRFDGTETGMELLHYVKNKEILPLQSFYENYFAPDLVTRTLQGEKFNVVKALDQISLPPEVKITNIVDGYHTKVKTASIHVIATDKGGGVDEIRLYQNGKLISGTNRGFKPSGEVEIFEVSLVKGENRFKALAFNEDRIESLPFEASIFYDGSDATAKLYTLTIGINDYKNSIYALNYAKADASSFKFAISEGGKSIFEEVVTIHLTDEEATKANIISALEDIERQIDSEDMFIFYYAGHGVMSDGLIGQPQFYIVPHDVTQMYGNEQLLKQKGISTVEIQEFTTSIKAQKQLFVLDACQSGGATQMLAARGSVEEKAISQLARSTGTYWLMASGSKQFASEFETLGHGVFTYAILEGLSGKADQGNKDKKITVQELSAYLNDRVPTLTERYRGVTQYPNSYGFGQDFPIVIVK